MLSLSELKDELNCNEKLSAELRLNDKVMGKYTVTSKGILGSIIIYSGLNYLTIDKSYTKTKLLKINKNWVGKVDPVFTLVVTKNIL